MTDKYLTPEESDALLADSTPVEEFATIIDEIRVVEPSYWEAAKQDSFPGLDAVLPKIAEAIDETWREIFRARIATSADEPSEVSRDEIAACIEHDDAVWAFSVMPVNSESLLIVQPSMISVMVDLFFGGVAATGRNRNFSSFGQMEQRMFQRFQDGLAHRLAQAWKRAGNFDFDRSSSFDLADWLLNSSDARPILTRFRFDYSDQTHVVSLVWPRTMVGAVPVPEQSAVPRATVPASRDWSAALEEEVKDARLELRAVLGEISMKLLDAANIRPGDVFVLEQLSDVRLMAGDQTVFLGTLGSHDGYNAVKIRHVLNKKHLGEN